MKRISRSSNCRQCRTSAAGQVVRATTIQGTIQRTQTATDGFNSCSSCDSDSKSIETLGETFRAVLNSLAVAAPDWLEEHLQDAWFERYSRRTENYRLPKLDSEREELGRTIGKDGFALLDAIY